MKIIYDILLPIIFVGICKIDYDEESSDVSESSQLVLRCPCGKCSLVTYLEKDCPKSKSGSFPYLCLTPELDKDTKVDLFSILNAGTDNMIKSFADLLDKISASLDSREISAEALVNRALSLLAAPKVQVPLLKEDEKQLRECKTIDGVFIVLHSYMNFFNFDLLKHITDSRKICSDEDRRAMEEYCVQFKVFCTRKVFEVPPGVFSQSTSKLSRKKSKTFAVLITEHPKDPTLQYADAAKVKIASLLNLLPSTLHLHRIDPGSLIFIFSIPTFVAKMLFPLEPSLRATLKAEGLHVFSTMIEDAPNRGMINNSMYVDVVCLCDAIGMQDEAHG